MAYREEVKLARERYEGAVEEADEDAAAEALRLSEQYGKPLASVCKEIAGKAWGRVDDKARRLKRSPSAAADDAAKRQMRGVRAMVKADPEAVAQALAKVAPDVMIEAATAAQGRTRSKPPSNKAKVEGAFGPEEFNRLEDALDAVLERLPDLALNREDKKYAVDLAAKTDGVASALRGWAEGRDIAGEVEEWLSNR